VESARRLSSTERRSVVGFLSGQKTRVDGKACLLQIPWFVSDVTKKDWDWILNSCVYGYLFPEASEEEMDLLRIMGRRWKQYEKEGKFR
jgi:hypothetical protein